MRVFSLKERLNDWTDPDGAQYYLAQCLGIIDPDTDFLEVKPIFWVDNDIGNMLFEMLTELVERGILETSGPPEHQFRWRQDFKGSWE